MKKLNFKKSIKWIIAIIALFFIVSVMVQGFSNKSTEVSGVVTTYNQSHGVFVKTIDGEITQVPGFGIADSVKNFGAKTLFSLDRLNVNLSTDLLLQESFEKGYPVKLYGHKLPWYKNIFMNRGTGTIFVDSMEVLSNLQIKIPSTGLIVK